jgi:uncharacterized OsmC-like protein
MNHSRRERPDGAIRSDQPMTMTDAALLNGVNVEAILGAREALKGAPEAAKFQWRARNEWVNGTHSRTTIEDFGGLGAEQSHKRAFTYDADHPELFASEDHGPTPVEFVLLGLASCLTAGIASVAANRGVRLDSVTSTLEGDMDLQGILGIDKSVRNGYQHIQISFDVKGDATDEELRKIVAQSQARSAVYDIVTGNVPVTITVNS